MHARISLDTHNVLDYVIGAVLVLSPAIFGFSDLTAARNLFLVLGFGLIAYSLCTNYRYSIFKFISVPTHMTFDVLAGLCLIAGPWLLGYAPLLSNGLLLLHFIYGASAILLVAFTQRRTRMHKIEHAPESLTKTTGETGRAA